MRFGFQIPHYSPTASADTIVRSVRLAEELGFDSVWTTDHIMVPKQHAVPYGNLVESLIALTLAAASTSRVQLGTSIIVMPQREPVLLAKQLASIDLISGGRLIYGAGTGWLEQEFEYLGANFDGRGQAFEEYMAVLQALWRGDEEFEGQLVSFHDALFSPLPPQGDQIPIWIAGNSPIAIRRAARIADAWHPVGLSPQQLTEGVTALQAASDGREVVVSLRVVVEMQGVGGRDEQLNEGQLHTWHILRGEPENIVRELKEFQEAGLEYPVLWFIHANWTELERSLIAFADQVMPAFR
jgi:probable F420-dependent oxidoreductase